MQGLCTMFHVSGSLAEGLRYVKKDIANRYLPFPRRHPRSATTAGCGRAFGLEEISRAWHEEGAHRRGGVPDHWSNLFLVEEVKECFRKQGNFFP